MQKEITFSDYNQAEGGPVSLNFTEKDVKIERSGLWDSAKFESAEICTVPVDEFVS